eukprot:Seg4013.4 transcript_id=Seg4013.4/GoldUCD/mRNA.D3Y31 product="hypothetical protein" protein_id=Seg4013.4/GoldUCD/D3Y31
MIAKAMGDFGRVKELNAEFQRKARRDKQKIFKDQCKTIEESNKKGRTRDLFKRIREITGMFTPRIGIVKNKQGKDLSEEAEVKTRWKEYTEDSYKRDATISDKFLPKDFLPEPSISESEVERAMKELANGKAPGIDNIPIEIFKVGGNEARTIITKICKKIWETTEWPRQWKQSAYIPIPKKGIHVHVKTTEQFLLLCMQAK